MQKVYLRRLIVAALLLLMTVILIIYMTGDISVVSDKKGYAQGGGSYIKNDGPYVEKDRLFDNLDAFIETVKLNLNVPNDPDITYSMGEPIFESVYNLETVYIMFIRDGEMVASAKCATKDGSLISSIFVYQEKEEDSDIPAKTEISSVPEYFQYKNSRFGYVINYPDFLIPEEESQNGDGRSFYSADREIQLQTWGSFFPRDCGEINNIEDFYNYVLADLEYEPTYTAKKNTYFVFTGYLGDRIVYEKYFLKSDKTESSFRIEYPAYLREEMYDVVTYIANSMSTGSGYDSPAEK